MEFDVIVVGAGPAGASTALALASQGMRIALAGSDARRARNVELGEILSADVTPSLHRLGLVSRFKQLDLTEVSGYSSTWGAENPESRSSLLMHRGCGWLLERSAFLGMLVHAAADAGCTLIHDDVVLCQQDGGRWRLRTREGKRELQGRIAVFATGRSSSVVRPPTRPRRVDKLVAYVAVFPGHLGRNQMVRVVACPRGWAYSAASGKSGSVIAFFTDADETPRAPNKRNELIVRAMQAIGLQPPENTGAEAVVRVTPCASMFLPVATGDDWIACGDAAQTVDPLSAMGIGNAIQDAIKASEIVPSLLSGRRSVALERELARRKWYLEYLLTRAAYYRRERRWAHEPFWARRHDLSGIQSFVCRHDSAYESASSDEHASAHRSEQC